MGDHEQFVKGSHRANVNWGIRRCGEQTQVRLTPHPSTGSHLGVSEPERRSHRGATREPVSPTIGAAWEPQPESRQFLVRSPGPGLLDRYVTGHRTFLRSDLR
jgi:hypothetical protein